MSIDNPMPSVYKKKDCPNCKKTHRGRGLYCSTSCANTGRKVTEETKQKLREKSLEYRRTPEGIATTKTIARVTEKRHDVNQKIKEGHYILEPEDYYVDVWTDETDDGFHL